MGIRELSIASALMGSFLLATPVNAAFDGEVLVAPPPPNWSGGIEQDDGDSTLRTWRRTFELPEGVRETITIRRTPLPETPDINALADTVVTRHAMRCGEVNETKRTTRKATIGSVLSFTLTCKLKPEGSTNPRDLFVRARVLVGEFNQYVIERVWIGDIKLPTSPINSPRIRASWQTFFMSTSVCNTLVSDCDEDRARNIHAHERFKKMRALPVVARPVMPAKDIETVATRLGQLTGRAEACGEDISPLTGKIGRMFAHVSENDQISSDAVTKFNAARRTTRAAQAKLSNDKCGEILRTFRSHPSRVGVFHKYVQRFL